MDHTYINILLIRLQQNLIHVGGKREDDMFHFCIKVLDNLYIPWKDWQIHEALCWRRLVWYYCKA